MIGRSTRSAFLPGHKEPAKVRVFFYGLFMDETILAEKGVTPSWATSGFVDGFRLYIGKRATLVREANSRSWGVMVDIAAADDIAKMAAFLLSTDADWITGQIIGVDGGRSTLRTNR